MDENGICNIFNYLLVLLFSESQLLTAYANEAKIYGNQTMLSTDRTRRVTIIVNAFAKDAYVNVIDISIYLYL